MFEDENKVEELVRLGVLLCNDLIDAHGDTWLHLAENQFDEVEHSLLVGVLTMFLKEGFEENEVVVILKVAISASFSMVYGDATQLINWKETIQ